MARTYLDFDLLIERTDSGYRARVLDSPAGQAIVDFVVPFSDADVQAFVEQLGQTVGTQRPENSLVEPAQRQPLRALGSQLFDAVFAGGVADAFRQSVSEATRKDAGLRVRLRLADVPELSTLPWEYLYNSTSGQFLCLSSDTPVVRYLELPFAVRTLSVIAPLNILVMISSPNDLPQLDVNAEWDRLEASLSDLSASGLVSLHRLDNATLSDLQQPLRRDEFHVLHFIGHGGFDEQAQQGGLVLETEDGRGRLVTGQDLGVMFAGHRSLRLVVLNACQGARSSSTNPFAGVAASLLHQGVPAAIAMQFSISDSAAITFAKEFYGALADGYPIDAAVSESRRAIFAYGNEVEWATAVLYMRSPNGRIFRVAPRHTQVQGAPAASVKEPEPAALSIPRDPLADAVLDALQRLLSRQADAVIIEVVSRDGRYVQATFEDSSLLVECVSPHFMSENQVFSTEELQTLTNLGWPEPAPNANYQLFFTRPSGAQLDEVASLLTSTLRLVHGAKGAEDVKTTDVVNE